LAPPIPPPHKYTRPRVPKFAHHKVNWDTSRISQQDTSIVRASTSLLSPSATPGPTTPTHDIPVHQSDLHTLVQNMTSSITQSLMQVVQGTAIGTPKTRRHIVVSKKVRTEATQRTKEPGKAALLVSHDFFKSVLEPHLCTY
jgi:hypothetical protein